MSSYRSYLVVLKEKNSAGEHANFTVTADDVDLDITDEKDTTAYFNFLKDIKDSDGPVTVAAVPFDNVLYIVSS